MSYFKEIIEGRKTISQWADEAKLLGLDGIDLSVILFKSYDSAYLLNIRREIEERNLTIAVVNTYPDFTHPDSAERERQFVKMEEHIAIASQVGAKMVRITAGQAHPETRKKEGIVWAVESFKRLSQIANYNNIRLVYENHSKPGVWNYPDFSMPKDIFLEICEKISETQIGILFDTANPLVCGDDPKFILEQVIHRVICVHAADTKMTGSLSPVIIGTGVVPFGELFARLSQFGYDGWISIEEASNMGESGMAEAVRYVRNTWEKVSR